MWLYPITMIITQIYFFVFGVLTLKYAIKSRNFPEKKDHPEYFKNEFIVSIMFFLLTIVYPWIWNAHVSDELLKHQFYFHMWDALTVAFIAWPIHLRFAQKNDAKHDRQISFIDWKEKVREEYHKKDQVKTDMKRKLLHLVPPALVIGMYYLGLALDGISMAGVVWGYRAHAIFWSVSFGFCFLIVMIIADLIRLNHFEKLGKFARDWAESAMIPKELNTFTSAGAMVMAFIPFYFTPFRIVISVVVITAVSDAAASLVGKKFGKKRNPNDPKTWEGYAAGFIATYLVVFAMNSLLNITEKAPPTIVVQLMALGAATGFFLVDKFARKISDNFLNPMVCGLIMSIVYFSF